MDTGKLIKELRIKNNMTQEELGEKLGVQKSAIAKYENGRVENLKRSTIQKLSEIFGVSPINFLGMSDNHNSSQWGDDRANVEYLQNKPELLDLYNEIRDREDIYILFDKTKDLGPKDVESVLMFVQTIRNQRGLD